MGMMKVPEKCFITDAPTKDAPSSTDAIEYFTEYAGHHFEFMFNGDHQNSEFVEENKYILQGLIVNNKFPYNPHHPFYDNKILEDIINEAAIPITPKAKLDNLLSYLFSLQDFEGSIIDYKSKIDHDVFLKKLYFKNHHEYWFYLSTLKEIGLIDYIDVTSKDGNDAMDIKITFGGLEYIIELQEKGELSKNCFVAMSFSKSMIATRDKIKEIIDKCGYNPILIDEINIDSEITINDAIISNIKSCKFLIADFTEQKHGVYFEVGFALGKNKPIIYVCRADDFENSHFDTNHYPHIVYKDLDDLHNKLIIKIKAWID